jgi:hypothetical protein
MRYIQDPKTLELIPVDKYEPASPRVYIHGDYDTYLSPVTGKPVTGRKQRRDDMKRHGCVDYEPSLKKYQEKRQNEPVFRDAPITGDAPYIRQTPTYMRDKR